MPLSNRILELTTPQVGRKRERVIPGHQPCAIYFAQQGQRRAPVPTCRAATSLMDRVSGPALAPGHTWLASWNQVWKWSYGRPRRRHQASMS